MRLKEGVAPGWNTHLLHNRLGGNERKSRRRQVEQKQVTDLESRRLASSVKTVMLPGTGYASKPTFWFWWCVVYAQGFLVKITLWEYLKLVPGPLEIRIQEACDRRGGGD